ncbi:MAG: cation:proton antiporter [Candidatus Izemoplasmataceae bacterium]|mgnify:CR=1 FL=1
MFLVTVEHFPMIIFHIGTIMLVGLVFGKLAEYLKLPDVTGYLIAGLLLGPITHFISGEELENLSLISYLALGFIAFQVGNELWLGKLKKSGKKIVIITLFQAVITTIVVSGLLMFVTNISVALILGAIAAATAPAPIMMLINKYRTKGDLTNTLVPVVGLDDAVGVILFGVLLSLGVNFASQEEETIHFLEMIKEPFLEIGYSIGLGLITGLMSGFAIRTITKNKEAQVKHLDVIIITVFITVGLALIVGASPILTPMIAGAVVTNLINKDTYVLEEQTIRFFIPPLMILFFTISGAQLSFSVLSSAGLIALIYILGRLLGKVGGSFIGANVVNASANVKKYLGFSMLPQSGVAIGLAIAANAALINIDNEMGELIHNITLVSVLFFALVGPVLVKIAFSKAGEIS